MQDVTLLLSLLSIMLFIGCYLIKKDGLNYLTFTVTVCGIAKTLTDDTLGDDMMLLMVPLILVFMLSMIAIYQGNKRRF